MQRLSFSASDEMTSSTFLAAEELHELTGYLMPSAQIRWLKKEKWVYSVSALGRPKVARGYFEKRMGVADDASAGQTDEPDFSHWKTAA